MSNQRGDTRGLFWYCALGIDMVAEEIFVCKCTTAAAVHIMAHRQNTSRGQQPETEKVFVLSQRWLGYMLLFPFWYAPHSHDCCLVWLAALARSACETGALLSYVCTQTYHKHRRFALFYCITTQRCTTHAPN